MIILTKDQKRVVSDDLKKQMLSFVGQAVTKRSDKPFKSGSKVNIVKDVVLHSQIHSLAFTFREDDSEVECWRCETVGDNI